jgi:CheY-like chemotaxis protein
MERKMNDNKNVRILVVDDSKVVLSIVCKLLTSLGYETVAAEDGRKALRILKSNNDLNLVLTDINMPDMDGWELALCIKSLKPDIMIIALTGEPPNNILPKLNGSGISHALFKPLKIDHLNEIVDTILQKHNFQ